MGNKPRKKVTRNKDNSKIFYIAKDPDDERWGFKTLADALKSSMDSNYDRNVFDLCKWNEQISNKMEDAPIIQVSLKIIDIKKTHKKCPCGQGFIKK